jgi:hypothetical protein
MTALRKSDLPEPLRNELARLVRAGFPLLPLGGGDDGKTPLTRAWAGPALPLGNVLAPMHSKGSRVYGIRLDGLVVVDCDIDDPALVADLESRFGPSPVHIKTPRGLHLYFRPSGPVPNLRGEGLPVDIKTGGRAYVVGPLSERRDGGIYAPVRGLLGLDALPPLRPVSGPLAKSVAVPVGGRHSALIREAIKMVAYVDDPEELTANLCGLRDGFCADPASVTDAELSAIARWAWQCRLEGRIHQGRHSQIRLDRTALDALLPLPNGGNALALLTLLIDKHGHTPGKRFGLSHRGMTEAGLIRLSREAFLAARRTLEAEGLLRKVENHHAGHQGQQFVLTRGRIAGAANVADLAEAQARERKGGKD